MAVKSAGSKPVHTVQVRELVEFVLRCGDLGTDRDFVGSDRALKGIRGHQQLQRSRPPGYQTELPVEYTVEAGEFTLRVRGRIDGLFATDEEVLLEEIKTIQEAWFGKADPLHFAQAKFYAFIHAQEQGLKEIAVQLAYLDLETGKVTEFRQVFTFTELSDFFATTVAVYVDWLRQRNDGTANGAILTTDRFGVSGRAMPFNGMNQFIQAPHQPYLTFPRHPRAYQKFWFPREPNRHGSPRRGR